MEWQPIKTAPKDGTPFLAYGGLRDDEPHGDYLYRNENPYAHPAANCAVTWWQDGEWIFASYDVGYYGYWYTSPAHWIPLPDPPSEATK